MNEDMKELFQYMNVKFDSIDQKFDSIDQKVDSLKSDVRKIDLKLENETNKKI